MKNLWRFSVGTTFEAEDAVGELLGATFGEMVSSHFNVETGVSVVNVYGERKMICSREVHDTISTGLKQIKSCGLNIGASKIKIAKVKREDWAESWKRHFKPIEIDDVLLVKPSWIKRKPRKNQSVVVLDPGLSFGTGQHPTTLFCLHQLATTNCSFAVVHQHSSHRFDATKSFLDLGTGSGILAIAAAKLGYAPIHALDFDPDCIRTAQANARMNRVETKLKIAHGDVTKLPIKPKRQYDLICANLISTLLIAEKQRIINRLKRDGTLVLAGILKSEFAEVQKSYEAAGLKLVAAKSEKEWRSGSFCFCNRGV